MARLTAVEEAPARATDVEARNEAIVRYMPLVRYVAKRVAQSYGLPLGVELGDLASHGVLGLIEAHERYEPSRGVTFETFAIPRIRGAILDELRRYDWVPRNVRARARRLNETVGVLATKLGRTPTRGELAEGLGVPELDAYERNSVPATVVGLDDVVRADPSSGDAISLGDVLVDPDAEVPGAALEDAERKEALVSAMDKLSERDRLILTLYYFENVPLGGIAKLLNVTESRVSQLHTRALGALQAQLRDD